MVDWQQVDKQTKIFSFEGRKCLGKVVDVYDGDTVKIVFPLTDNEPERLYKWNCRLINVDTPEIRTKNQKEKVFAKHVRDNLRDKILHKLVDIECKNFDKYGRLLVEIFYEGININEWLVENNYAKKYYGGKKTNWFIEDK